MRVWGPTFKLHRDGRASALTVAALTVALVAVLIPMCAMALCAPVGGAAHHMGGGLSSLLTCNEMYLPGDVPLAVFAGLLALAVYVAVTALASPVTFVVARPLAAPARDIEPHPPDDPLVGRLLI